VARTFGASELGANFAAEPYNAAGLLLAAIAIFTAGNSALGGIGD
jgi:hypothetical protein